MRACRLLILFTALVFVLLGHLPVIASSPPTAPISRISMIPAGDSPDRITAVEVWVSQPPVTLTPAIYLDQGTGWPVWRGWTGQPVVVTQPGTTQLPVHWPYGDNDVRGVWLIVRGENLGWDANIKPVLHDIGLPGAPAKPSKPPVSKQ